MRLPQLHRVRWAVRASLALGVAASVVANILHAEPNPISQAIAAWPPLALLLNVELISRIPVHRRSLAVGRMVATAGIAGIAAWVSYWHMAGVAARYGETGASPYLLPLSVDGLIIVASICLVELGGRINASEAAAGPSAVPATATVAAASEAPATPTRTAPTSVVGDPAEFGGTTPTSVGNAAGSGGTAPTAAGGTSGVADRTGKPRTAARGRKGSAPAHRPKRAATTTKAATGAETGDGPRPVPTETGKRAGNSLQDRPRGLGTSGNAPRPRRPVAETAALAAEIEAKQPELSESDVAEVLGITPARLRAVRRQARELELAA